MTAGLLSVIIVICIGILILSGWSAILFPGYAAITGLTVLSCWLLCAGRQVKIGSVHIDITWAIWIIAAVAGLGVYWFRQNDWTARLLMCSHIFLFGSIWFLMGTTREIGYGTIPDIPVWLLGMGIGVLGGMLYTSVVDQWIVFTMSYAIGEALMMTRSNMVGPIQLGSAEVFDAWWITIAAARVCTVMMLYVLLFSPPKVDNS